MNLCCNYSVEFMNLSQNTPQYLPTISQFQSEGGALPCNLHKVTHNQRCTPLILCNIIEVCFHSTASPLYKTNNTLNPLCVTKSPMRLLNPYLSFDNYYHSIIFTYLFYDNSYQSLDNKLMDSISIKHEKKICTLGKRF